MSIIQSFTFAPGPWKLVSRRSRSATVKVLSSDDRVLATHVSPENASLIAAAWEGFTAAESAIRNNGGPSLGPDGREYTLVRLDDFQNLVSFVSKISEAEKV